MDNTLKACKIQKAFPARLGSIKSGFKPLVAYVSRRHAPRCSAHSKKTTSSSLINILTCISHEHNHNLIYRPHILQAHHSKMNSAVVTCEIISIQRNSGKKANRAQQKVSYTWAIKAYRLFACCRFERLNATENTCQLVQTLNCWNILEPKDVNQFRQKLPAGQKLVSSNPSYSLIHHTTTECRHAWKRCPIFNLYLFDSTESLDWKTSLQASNLASHPLYPLHSEVLHLNHSRVHVWVPCIRVIALAWLSTYTANLKWYSRRKDHLPVPYPNK